MKNLTLKTSRGKFENNVVAGICTTKIKGGESDFIITEDCVDM